ncbi:MAG: alpha/beta fold hydrolase [Ketobacteraceae bacterium]|nr:alpha/beta fold hydrolase [Ketobacteraceae bacterium]
MSSKLKYEEITLRGCQTAYIDTDSDISSTRPIVICLHGLPSSSFMYRKVIDDLSFEARVLAPDLPGFGNSQKITAWELSFAEYEVWLDRFITELVPADAKINLILHDISGPFGLAWAARNPGRIQSLLILNTTIFIEHFRPPLPAIMGMIPKIGHRLVEAGMHGRILEEGLKREFHCPMDEDTLQHYCAPYDEPETREALANVFANYAHAYGYLKELRNLLKNSVFPCTILFGQKDKYCRPSNATAFANHIHGAYVRFLQSVGHFVAEEAPFVVADEMRHLLRQTCPKTELPTQATEKDIRMSA